MNAPAALSLIPSLHGLALAALESTGDAAGGEDGIEARWLRAQRALGEACPRAPLRTWLAAPPEEDRLLHALAGSLRLQPIEIIAVALAVAVETDALVGRVVAWLQAPTGGSRPNVGLILAIASALGLDASLTALLEGAARDTGLLWLESDSEPCRRPLPEQFLQVPAPLCLTLREGYARWPEVELATDDRADAVASLRQAAARQAHALRAGGGILVVRGGHPREARNAAILVARELGGRAALFDREPPKGAGLWLTLVGAIPVLRLELAPGETRKLPPLPGYRGPVLVACGLEGGFEREGESDDSTVGVWRVPLPPPGERAELWAAHTADPALARRLGEQHRHDGSRIHLLGRAARFQASLDAADKLTHRHVSAAARGGVAAELGTLAELWPEDIDDTTLIVPAALREALLALRRRCEIRESLADGLGPSARARYKPGVRALFVGPSGTGKTLAVGWLATRLGLPLYRVDIASVTSKYIGETEKNLARLFSRAEHAEVVLLFDEADSLFGKRTEVKESNDRFANAQTNYLLQRIESFEGIAILTSNSRSRFDSAFTRRLDAILDFPQPTPETRRALWSAHLGDTHQLDNLALNRLAANCDLAGGHIRNAVLAAAVAARAADSAIRYGDVLAGIAAEYLKLGKQPPAGLHNPPGGAG